MRKKIFYFEPFRKYDIISITVYIILSLLIIYFYGSSNSFEMKKDLLFGYTICTSMFLYLFNYVSLRNLSIYFTWIVIAIIQFLFYLNLKDDPNLNNVNGHAAIGLRNILILLLFYQILRFVNIKIQNQEFVAPSKGSRTDLIERRSINIIDYISFILYIALFALLQFMI